MVLHVIDVDTLLVCMYKTGVTDVVAVDDVDVNGVAVFKRLLVLRVADDYVVVVAD